VSTLKTIKLQNPSGTSSNIDLGTGGEVLIGSASTTGTASQTLQVTGGAYVSGSIGIGTTNPAYTLDVFGVFRTGGLAGDAYLALYADNSGNTFSIESANKANTVKKDITLNAYGGNTLVGTSAATGTSNQKLQVGGGAYVSGSLGVGVTNPSYKTHIVSSGDILALESTTNTDRTTLKFLTNGSDWEVGARGSAETISPNSFYLFDNGTNYFRMVLNSSGNIGIGSISSVNIKGGLNLDKSSSAGTVAAVPSIVFSNRNQTDAIFVHSGIFADCYRDVANPSYAAGIWFQRVPEINNLSSGANIIFGATFNSNENSLPTEKARITYGGYFKASNIGGYQDTAGAFHEFYQTQNDNTMWLRSTNASLATRVIAANVDRAANIAYSFFVGWSGNLGDVEFNLRGDGQAYADGSWNGGGADYAEMFEWADGNANNEDRVGYTVSLVGNKIKIAEEGEDIIGVISGNPSVVGDTSWNKWAEKYLKDSFNRYIFEEHNVVEWTDEDGKEHSYEDWNLPEDITVPTETTIKTHDDKGNRFTHRKLNPEYDPDQEYVSREDRQEWDAVGLVGKLRVRKGQVIGNRWIKMQDIDENVEEWLVR